MNFEFTGEIWYWRGPAPFYFITIPPEQSEEIGAIARLVTYGWGVIPVTARIGETEWTTSLFPKGDLYALPVKVSVRRAENLDVGDEVTVSVRVAPRR